MHQKTLLQAGLELGKAKKALVLIHGRGASAEDIISLTNYLNVEDFAIIAPQATNHTWYPYPFIQPVERNEPWLSSALSLLSSIVSDIEQAGIPSERIFIAGFSQGACLSLEFAARNARRWGGVAAFTGGLIGETINATNYKGDFAGTPIFVGSSDPDPHIPVSRVHDSVTQLRALGARVEEHIFPNMGHTVGQQELEIVNRYIFGDSAQRS